jgi:serine/threonine-protein kinase ULK/ATG1
MDSRTPSYRHTESTIASSMEIPDLPMKLNNYILTKEIGSGSYGVVYQAFDQNSKASYALKKVNKKSIYKHQKLKKLFNDEIDITSTIKHANIIHLFEVLETTDDFFLVYDFCELGNAYTCFLNDK